MEFNFKEKNILVTGYFSDIGMGICEMYKSLGGNVISTYNKTKGDVKEGITLFKLDLNSKESIYSFLKNLKDTGLHKIHILINNIGICNIEPLIFLEDEELESIMNINLTNTIILTKHILKDFMVDGGKILNISSIWGRVGASCEVPYSSSKGGINIFTRALSKEIVSRDIKVLSISPGFIKTKMNDKVDSTYILDEIPLGYLGEVKDVTDSIKFFSSDHINISGEIINIDGGWMM